MNAMTRLPAAILLLASSVAAAQADIAPTDPVLDAYLAEALNTNPALQARDAASDASAAAADAARAQRLPSMELRARYTRAEGGRTIDFPAGDLLNGVYSTLNSFLQERGEAPMFPQIENQSIALLREREQDTRLALTAPLYAPALWAQADALSAQHGAVSAAREAFARALVREVKRAYYGAVQADASERILASAVGLLEEDVRVSQSLVDAGKATRDRVLRAQAERLAIVQRQDQAALAAAQARRQLNALRDVPADTPVALADPKALALPQSGAFAAPRPELRQLDQAIAAADAARRAAAAGQQPTIALAADYGVQGVDYNVGREDDFSSVSLVLNWTLWDFGARAGKRRQAEAETDRLRAERRDLEHKLAIAQWSATESLQLALRSIDAASARVAAAEEVFRIAERKRAAASLSQVEFIDAQRSQTEARLNLAIARCEALDRAAELELANASFPLNAAQRSAPPATANTIAARSTPRLASKLTSSLSNSPATRPE
ncbi:MAG: TolC family protein [Pseudomonadota bacterium]|nr:TolC family protein [Pseudomonadota bacterium]